MNQPEAERTTGTWAQLLRVVGSDLSRVARQRRTAVVGAVQLLPVVGAILLLQFFSTDGLTTYTSLVENVVFPLLLPAVAIVFGGPLLVSEIERQTVTYLTARPVGKRTLFTGKWLASSALSTALGVLPLVGLFLVCLVIPGQLAGSGVVFGRTLLAAVAGVVTYTAIFAAISALFATNLVASVVYYTVVELGLGLIPTVEIFTVRFHLQNVAGLSEGSPTVLTGLFPDSGFTL
ncbi:MAG: ABC transporter permease, partial [Bradymonadaceae bacterium]